MPLLLVMCPWFKSRGETELVSWEEILQKGEKEIDSYKSWSERIWFELDLKHLGVSLHMSALKIM